MFLLSGMDRKNNLRPIDQKRCNHLEKMIEQKPLSQEKWYIHSVLAQCFLPYRDQKNQTHWVKENGNVALSITADTTRGADGKLNILGLPYGAKNI